QFGKVDRRRVQAAPHAEGHVLFRDEPFVHQNFEQTTAFGFLNADRLLELVGQEQAVLNQNVGDSLSERFASAHVDLSLRHVTPAGRSTANFLRWMKAGPDTRPPYNRPIAARLPGRSRQKDCSTPPSWCG